MTTITKLKNALAALEANHQWHIDYDEHNGYAGSDAETQNLAAIGSLRSVIAEMEAGEPVSAEIRFCHPQKTAIDSGWGQWQKWKILAKTPEKIDSQGYLVDYRLLYTHAQSKAEPAHSDDIAVDRFAEAMKAEPSSSDKTWCQYIAGMIGAYLGEPVDSDKCVAIAGIIERRLWALPHPKAEPKD